MNAKQKAKIAMYNAVLSFCDKNIVLINSMPALLASYTSFKNTVILIAGITQKKADVLTGVAMDKANTRDALARMAATIAAQIYAYANANGLDALKERVNFSMSYLKRLKDVELPAVCKNILKAAIENATALVKYNVTAHMITEFSNLIATYEALEPDPRNALIERAMHNVTLKSLIQTADSLLKNEIDKMFGSFITTKPDFLGNYRGNREVVDASTTATQIKGKITDRKTKKPIDGAKVNITGTDITVTTNARGRFVIKLPQPDKYNVTVSKSGYKTLSFSDLVVKLGQIERVSGEMELI